MATKKQQQPDELREQEAAAAEAAEPVDPIAAPDARHAPGAVRPAAEESVGPEIYDTNDQRRR